LEVALLLAVAAGCVRVPHGGAGAGLIPVVDAFLLEAEDSELAKLVIRQILTDIYRISRHL